jgi:Domain of unknown function (DUF6265)
MRTIDPTMATGRMRSARLPVLALAALGVLAALGALAAAGADTPKTAPPATTPATTPAKVPAATPAVPPAAPLTIDRVAFLEGCWEQTSERQTVEEQWTAPRGGTMLSIGRTVRDGRLVDFEFVVLREQDGVLAYEAHPSKQDPAVFTARSATDIRVVFENPEHDFPKSVGYERTGPDSLLAWIEGPRRGGNRRMDFIYKRVACPGGAAVPADSK